MDKSPFVEAYFYLLLRIDRSFVGENGQNGHISKLLRLNQCGERGEGVYKLRRLPQKMTIDGHYTYSIQGSSPLFKVLRVGDSLTVCVNLHLAPHENT